MSAELFITLSHLSVTFSEKVHPECSDPNGNGGLQVLDDLSFTIQPQEFLCILGPSGSGKTTLLRVLAGLLQPTQGEVYFNPDCLGGRDCRIGLVFQQANLMPWRTALQNITLPLELQGASRPEALQKAQEMVELLGLQGFENAWPRDLSGGMAQRVAIGRALIQDPDLLLLDEPFGSLDALTRERMGAELLNLWQARRKTVIMVTHSISEALLLADRILVLSQRPGRIRQDQPVQLPRPRQDDIRYTPEFTSQARLLKNAIEA